MESGVKLIACQMTMDVMGYKQSDIITGVEFGGAATWMDHCSRRGHKPLYLMQLKSKRLYCGTGQLDLAGFFCSHRCRELLDFYP